jgi:hypothetical protein
VFADRAAELLGDVERAAAEVGDPTASRQIGAREQRCCVGGPELGLQREPRMLGGVARERVVACRA